MYKKTNIYRKVEKCYYKLIMKNGLLILQKEFGTKGDK